MIENLEISLAMSGGGLRATLFHLGVVKRLFELGLFKRIKTISSVSGGSILNGLLGIHYDAINELEDFEALIERPILKLCRVNLRNRILFFRGRRSSQRFAKLLDKHLYKKSRLNSLSENVRTLINATNLNSSARWRFEREDFGDYKTGYCYSTGTFPLSRAVAASAELPGLFSPVKLKTGRYSFMKRNVNKEDVERNKKVPRKIYLADGGIYDNTGYHALHDELQKKPERFVIVSDASGYFDESGRKYGHLSQIGRTLGIVLERLNSITKKNLFEQLDSGELKGFYFTLKNSCKHYRESTGGSNNIPGSIGWSDEDIEPLSKMRTDLDRFKAIEIDYLMYHGASLVDVSLRKWHSDLYAACEPAHLKKPNHPAKKVKKALSTSKRHIRMW